MSDYLVESPHTKEECLRALDEVLDKGADVLAKFEFGCKQGDHTAYAIVRGTEASALELVPKFLRGKAKIVPVEAITPDQIRAFHGGSSKEARP